MKLKQDADFDDIASAFEEDIYGSSKGHVRLHVLWEDLLTNIPHLGGQRLSILDAGGGAGHIAVRLARLGHKVVLADPSREMLDRAETSIREARLTEITTVQATIQELTTTINERFDVITCHAVLEWLAEPKEALSQLVGFLKPDGYLSLMFYNRNAWLLKRILTGDFAAALTGRDAAEPTRTGWGEGATPLGEEAVREWLTGLGFVVRSKSGIRIFHDHVPLVVRSRNRRDELLAVEQALRSTEPFASLGQHVHLVCARARG